jgi:CHAT domain-containing protein
MLSGSWSGSVELVFHDFNRISLMRNSESCSSQLTLATPLDLEEELRAIEVELRGALHRDSIMLTARHAVRPDDLVRHIRADMPDVIHFSGHGTSEGIVLRDDVTGYRTVPGAALSRLLKDRGIRLVVLNACFSSEQANSLSDAVNTIVGTTKEVDDEAARRFSVAFYRTLGEGYSVGDAFRDGGDAIALHSLEDVYQIVGATDTRLVKT